MRGGFKKLYTALILALFMLLGNAYGAYEVYHARTLGSTTPKAEIVEEDPIPTFNDPELPRFSEESSRATMLERKYNKWKQNRLNKKNKNEQITQDEDTQDSNEQESDPQLLQSQSISKKEPPIEDKNKFLINADKITYDDTDGNVYAKGNVEIISVSQKVVLKADDAILDKESQTIKLQNNVKILKDGMEVVGDYMLVDLNEQNVLMDEPVLNAYMFTAKGQEGYLIANDIELVNGTITSSKDTKFPLVSGGFQRVEPMGVEGLREAIEKAQSAPNRKQAYRIDSKEIVVTCYKDHNSVVLKDSKIYYNNHKILPKMDIEILSDKKINVADVGGIEAGSLRDFGMYVDYGFLFKIPKGQVLKLSPALVYGDSNLGVGLIGRHQSENSMLEAGYNTASTNLVAKGKYNFGKSVVLRYGRSSYQQEGFFGARRPGYFAQLESIRMFRNRDLGVTYTQGLYGGFVSEYTKHDKESHAYGTMRFRYMGQITKTLLKYQNKEQDLLLELGALTRGAATLYGSGQTHAVAQIGPYVRTRFKNWDSKIGYTINGIHGDSPFRFDQYRYGTSTVYLNEKFNIGRLFAVGYRANITPNKDNYRHELMSESAFYAVVGPDDLKLSLGYDFMRDIAHFEFLFLLGTKSTKIDFEKLTTKNMDGSKNRRDFYRRTKKVEELEEESI